LLKKNLRDIQSEKAVKKIEGSLLLTSKFGQNRFESENMTKSGNIIPVEMKSRIIEFKGRNAILTIARDISERKEIEERILTTIIQTEDNERQRLAEDLHDGLAPILSTIKLYADLLKKDQYKNIDRRETVDNIDELIDLAITSTREISRNIRSNILHDFGLAEAISDFVTFINYTKTINIRFDRENYSVKNRGIEESVLYQAVKELINNSIKHSSAGNITIELKNAEEQIILYYRDDGVGFETHRAIKDRKGLGLNNLMNKIKSIQGTVDLYSEPGKGMVFIATVKLKNKHGEVGYHPGDHR
jgi:signal transduction histidine kinase